MGNKAIAIVLAVIALSATVGVGYAYTSTLNSGGNQLDVEHIYAVDSKGSSLIQIPAVEFTHVGSTYVPADEKASVSGNLTLVSNDESPVIRAWVEFDDALSWTAITAVTVTFDGTEYSCFSNDPSSESRSLQTSMPTDAITTTTGNHTFQVTVMFNTGMDVDPSEYTGANMHSRIVFLMNGTDPMTTNEA